MKIAVATDFIGSTGSPERPLRLIAEAGFTHLHWCHQWCTDFLYGKYEIAAVKQWLKELGLTLLDIHGSAGVEKAWFSTVEYERLSGVELVINRIEMLTELEGTGSIMMHVPHYTYPDDDPSRHALIRGRVESLKRSLDTLMPVLEKHRTRIAIENMANDSWEIMDELLDAYPPECLGICYDSGHANILPLECMEFLNKRRNRLEALHLHDNDGSGDRHQPPYMGTVNWERLAGIIANSSYTREISFELSMRNTPYFEPEKEIEQQTPKNIHAFLFDAYERCVRFAKLVENKRISKKLL